MHLRHCTRSVCEGGMAISSSQMRHLKCMIRLMRLFVVLLFLAVPLQAQTIADVARKERERQANLRPTVVITSVENDKAQTPGTAKPEDAKTAGDSKAAGKAPAPPPVDPVKMWNDEVEQLRVKLRALQDQETALQLQLGQISNQVFATVTSPEIQSQVQTQLGQTQEQLAKVRIDLVETKTKLDSMELAGPPRK